ncbi:MAG: ureidoglycolate lyase [Spirochaetales bacterium]|nr:ureidoglycolate lyase [Spirochaetales bacterium]
MNIIAEIPDKASFQAYGSFVSVEPTQSGEGTESFTFWDKLCTFSLSQGSLGLVRSYPRVKPICSSLERHKESSEVLIPVMVPVAVICALSSARDENTVDRKTIKALVVSPGEALVLHPGVWHSAPYVHRETADTFVIFRNDTLRNDLIKVDFPPEERLSLSFETLED